MCLAIWTNTSDIFGQIYVFDLILNKLEFLQINFEILTNILRNFDKYDKQFGKIYFVIWIDIFCHYSADTTWIIKTGRSTQ